MDAYSRIAVPMILGRFPEWEPFARLDSRADGAGNTVDFNIPCPSGAAESGLWISTADEEFSVGFHTHHCHFTDYESRNNPIQIEAGLKYAADIIDERLGVVSWYRAGCFVGSFSVELPYPAPLPGLFDDARDAQLVAMFSNCDRATLRSWLGHFDRDEVRS
ncbi:MAG: hypothetical protein JNM56_19155 [Planctomycetia bacterium]|nr:hypothetical protein [Planctomycetia bacterium]